MADERDMLLVQSKVRDVIKTKGGEQGIRTSEEFLTALNEFVHESLDKAITRARGNGRSTLRREDI